MMTMMMVVEVVVAVLNFLSTFFLCPRHPSVVPAPCLLLLPLLLLRLTAPRP